MDQTPHPAPASPVLAAPSASPPPQGIFLAWPRSAQWAAAFLLGVVLTLLAVHALTYLRAGTRATDHEPGHASAYRIDLNQATRAELLQLPGVGPALADNIEAYRRVHGGFECVEDLRKVPGIGHLKLERLRSWVMVRDDGEDAPPGGGTAWLGPASPRSPAKGKKEIALAGVTIDVNSADAEELQRLPGVGKVLSQRIVDEREKAPFRTVAELRRVKGIGPKVLERLRPYVTAGENSPRVVRND